MPGEAACSANRALQNSLQNLRLAQPVHSYAVQGCAAAGVQITGSLSDLAAANRRFAHKSEAFVSQGCCVATPQLQIVDLRTKAKLL